MKIDQVDAESRVLHVARLKSGVTDDTALTRATDIGESRFWRLDHPVDYGARNGLASHRLNPKLITQNWGDFLRVAGSLKMGKLSASELIHALAARKQAIPAGASPGQTWPHSKNPASVDIHR